MACYTCILIIAFLSPVNEAVRSGSFSALWQACGDETSLVQLALRLDQAEANANLYVPKHGQEDIQKFILQHWLRAAAADPKVSANGPTPDLLQARFAEEHSKALSGWCDGWAFVLAQSHPDGSRLPVVWEAIDKAIDGETPTQPILHEAMVLARVALFYHVMNGDYAPTGHENQMKEYKAAGFGGQKPAARENWSGDETLALHESQLQGAFKDLRPGQTMRLTSSGHDAAARCINKDQYIVAETEGNGVQELTKTEALQMLLKAHKTWNFRQWIVA
jgi:hypothetical protein